MKRRSGYGWMALVVGLLFIFLGIFTMANPNRVLTGFVLLFGAVAVIMGVSDVLLYIRLERYTGFGPMVSLISGILSVMAGIGLFVQPDIGSRTISLIFPIWFIAHCISRMAHLTDIKLIAGRGLFVLTLLLNIAGLALGVFMIFQPLFSVFSIGFLTGAYLLLLGIDSVFTALSSMGSK